MDMMDSATMDKRGLGSAPAALMEKSNDYNANQILILRVLALTAASISMLAGLLALYWFIRMRKTFRHHLIMLLITSNFTRALWYFVYPIVSFIHGTVQSDAKFCQASGFLLAFGIEGADFVVFIMALHASLCIFKPKTALGETGLYRYRYLVYALWIALPALAAGLAFVNPEGGYVTSGTYCYLPIRPFWYRIALAWCPRYIILVSIAVMYLAIYMFVRRNFAQFHATGSTGESPSGPGGSSTMHSKLLRMSAADTMVGTATPHMSQRGEMRKGSHDPNEKASTAWENYTFGSSSPIATVPEFETVDMSVADVEAVHTSEKHPLGDVDDSENQKRFPALEERANNHNMIRALRTGSHPSEIAAAAAVAAAAATTAPHLSLKLINSHNQPLENEALRARHKAIRRQMRFLFIYPLVYLALWIIPFVQHCLDFSDSYVNHPNFGLSCASTVILALQCTVDSLLFSIREKPWRYSSSDDGYENRKTVLQSLTPICWIWWRQRRRPETSDEGSQPPPPPPGTRSSSFRISFNGLGSLHASKFLSGGAAVMASSTAGKSKGERVAEARAAARRKDAEKQLARGEAEETMKRRKMSFLRREGRDRNWWEEEGRKRKDSVLLGTDSEGVASSSPPATGRARAKTVVETIGEEHEPVHEHKETSSEKETAA